MSIKYSLLTLLRSGPQSASGLQQGFNDATHNIWPLNIGQVAQTLKRLERDGLIKDTGPTTSPTGRTVSAYALTPTGRSIVDEWFTTPVERSMEDRDELVMKVSMATASGDMDITEILDAQRHNAMQQLRSITASLRNQPQDNPLSTDVLQLERSIFELEAELRFLDRIEALHRERNSHAHH